MVTYCEDGRKVFESRGMGKMWTKAVRTLLGVWLNPQSAVFWDESLRVGAIITETVGEKKVMLYTWRGHASGKKRSTVLYLWVADKNSRLHLGPVAVDKAANWMLASIVPNSDGNLRFLQRRASERIRAVSLAYLAEELKTIKSTLSTWAQLDLSFSKLSTPTVGLVGLLSNASSGNVTWIDEYRCVNAIATETARVKNGFDFTVPGFMAVWSISRWGPNNQYCLVNYDFNILATVTIYQVAKGSTPLLGASLGDTGGKKFTGLSYSMNKILETVLNGTKTAKDSTWETGREHRVAPMLQGGNKGSVYVDGVIVGRPETIPTVGTLGHEITRLFFGGEGDANSNVTVTNVFLYNRPLNSTDMRAINERIPVSTSDPEPQVEDAPQTTAPVLSAVPAVPGPEKTSTAPGRTNVGRAVNTQNALAESLTSAGNEGMTLETSNGGANDDAGSAYRSGLLLLLLLLGLWRFAAA
ncbi:trans-sialidase, putative [Trypanosoma cruzi marinkellei]|uniref:Trans-sialidase, putative n=1 Tax=Trypanosoma cruzi marinkellei TaxID=85056 RepID=K2NPP5_TRYCR|nr:trans-sialidase, putative [Trypanosoma cruzi marinkellei]